MGPSWTPPEHWLRITTLEAHTAGEPLRIITGGFPEIPGDTILAKRRWARERLDGLRTALMWEPRGHADMYGALLTEPVTPDGDLGVLFLHNAGFSTMCGHGVIGLAMAGVEGGVVRPPNPTGDPSVLTLRLDTPAGRVTAFSRLEGGRVREASFLNVPSFVYALDERVEIPGLGAVRYDLAFGGAFYAFCRAEELGVSLEPGSFREIMDAGMRVKRAVMEAHPIRHPLQEDLGFLYGTIIVGDPLDSRNHSRNVCVFADGEVDRSPTGTGVSARAALHLARGEIALGEEFTVESILGTTFSGSVEETTHFGGYDAVIPRVTGTSHITGRNEILIDPQDPLRHGFILR
jgi:trans-L-3-hydroxyproline dehydratase